MPNNASSLVAYGSYTNASTAVPRTIEIPPGVDYFMLRNRTDWGDTTAVTNVQSEFQRGQTPGTAQGWTQAVTTNVLSSNAVTTQGFTFLDSYDDAPGAQLSFSAITNALPPVVSSAATTGLTNLDIVRIYNSTTAKQINGYDFTINNLVANTSFELIFMDSPGSVGGTGNYRRIPFDLNWYPRRRLITKVASSGTSTVVTLSVTHTYVVGEKVQFKVPSQYGMTQLNNLVGEITAVNTGTTNADNTITVNIDSSAFTAFAFPSSATAALGATPAQVVPYGEVATILTAASENAGFRGVHIGANVVGPNSATMDWWAFKADVNI